MRKPGTDEADDSCVEAQGGLAGQALASARRPSTNGLRLDVYLSPRLAAWVQGLVERGVFADPSDAVSELLNEHRDLEPYIDLRAELLRRMLQAELSDRSAICSGEDVKRMLVTDRTYPCRGMLCGGRRRDP